MHSSYSLHIPEVNKLPERRRKRKVISILGNESDGAFKYCCIACKSDVFFSPGHELVCANCASRTVEKIEEMPKKRSIPAR